MPDEELVSQWQACRCTLARLTDRFRASGLSL